MPRTEILQTPDETREAEQLVKSLIQQYGVDFVLRICAVAAIEREAAYRATQTFTGKDAR